MSRETEKVLKEMNKFLEEHADDNMSQEELSKFLNEHMMQINSKPIEKITEKSAKTSDDFLELAYETDSEAKAISYVKKAIALDEDNLDAIGLRIELTARNTIDALKQYEKAVAHGTKVMEKKGFLKDSVGRFWGVLETRPYMRLRSSYADILIECSMFKKAIGEYEDMIRLNENDNLGKRFTLMHLYALLEMEDEALNLLKQYGEHDETPMIFPLSILYFKMGDLKNAEVYLKRSAKANKDTKKFIKSVINETWQREVEKMNDYGYRPFSIEEYVTEMLENSFLFKNCSAYFLWAADVMKI